MANKNDSFIVVVAVLVLVSVVSHQLESLTSVGRTNSINLDGEDDDDDDDDGREKIAKHGNWQRRHFNN